MRLTKNRFRTVLAAAAAAMTVGAALNQAQAVTYIEQGGVVSIEGEAFSSRTFLGAQTWRSVPSETAAAGASSNFRGNGFAQALPDDLSAGGGPNNPPTVSYSMQISTPGIYQLFLRWDGNATNATTQGQSDSMFADIVELKDGAGGAVADHYEFAHSVDGNFNTGGSAAGHWDGTAGFEVNNAGGTPKVAATFNITTPGVYNLRFSEREDGTTVDAAVLQLASLPAPTNTGPVVSLLTGATEGSIKSLGAINDAFVRTGTGANGVNNGTELLLKHTGTDTTRKTWIQFDIGAAAGQIMDAALDLEVSLNNQGGTSTSVPASFIVEVFGLNDGNPGESWDDSTLTFNNAPGNAAGNGVNAGQTTFLGTFNVPAIHADSTAPILLSFANLMSASPDAMLNFLNADMDGLVTFILRRPTAGGNGSFNLGFFSSEAGSSGQGPILRLNVAVPEPTTALLMLLGLPIAMRRRRCA